MNCKELKRFLCVLLLFMYTDCKMLPPDKRTTNGDNGLNRLSRDIHSRPSKYRTVVTDRSRLWPTSTIPYSMDPGYDKEEMKAIMDALGEFHNKTCVRFVPRRKEQDYIFFVQHIGCYSSVGRSGDRQMLTLGKPCLTKGTAIHEIMHALGFWHEHNRADRDQYVQIIWDNIEEGREFNFEKFPVADVDVLGTQYDYESIMHYSRTAFSRNGQATIRPIRPFNKTLGQRDHLSSIDVWKVNTIFRCLPAGSTPQASAQMTPSTAHSPQTPPGVPHHIRTPPPLTSWSIFSAWSPCDANCTSTRTRFCFRNNGCGSGASKETSVCSPPCLPAFHLGCWENNIFNPSIPMIVRQRASPQFHSLEAYRECADAARELGYPVFALFRDGDCLTGPHALKTFAKHGRSQFCGLDRRGSNIAMNVFSYDFNIDGGWGSWGDWSNCASTCGSGTRMRRRICASPPPFGSGKPCPGSAEGTGPCTRIPPCHVGTGSWSPWPQWDQCSRSCGMGLQTRKRTCVTTTSGSKCTGHDVVSKHCISKACKQSQGCGALTDYGTHGNIRQGSYSNSMSCGYHIVGLSGTSVLLEFDRMDVEDSRMCVKDSVTIFDGNSSSANLVRSVCGQGRPDPVQSSGRDLYLLFQSDSTVELSGYSLRWRLTVSTGHLCPQPTEPVNGRMTGGPTQVGDKLHFSCHIGYQLFGSTEVTCVAFDQHHAVWDTAFPRCQKSHPQSPVVVKIG